MIISATVTPAPLAATYRTPRIEIVEEVTVLERPTTAISFNFDSFVKAVEHIRADAMLTRIKNLAALHDGWLDGEGTAFPASSANWLLENFAKLNFNYQPGLSPTPEGNFCAEWSVGDWEASAEINLLDHTVSWHALNIADTRQEQNEEFKLASDADWQRLRYLANALTAANAWG